MHVWSKEIRSHGFKDVQGAEDVFYLFFAPTKTNQAKGKEFVGRIFTREQDRDQIPGLAVATRSPKRSLTGASPT